MDLITWFFDLSPTYLIVAFFVIFAIEGTGLPGVPFEPLFLAAAFLIAKGEMNFWLVVLSGSSGNLVGNLLGYWIGASPRMKLLVHRLTRSRPENTNNEKWRLWMDRYGPPMVIIGRWFGPIRTVTILGAGTVGMNFWAYLVYSAIGAVTWTAAWQWLFCQFTDLAMHWWQRYREHHLFYVVLTVGALLLVVAGVFYWRRRCRNRERPQQPSP